MSKKKVVSLISRDLCEGCNFNQGVTTIEETTVIVCKRKDCDNWILSNQSFDEFKVDSRLIHQIKGSI